MKDRAEMLKVFLNNKDLKEMASLTKSELGSVGFSSVSPDPLVEALKKLIFSYCQEDAPVTVLRNVNMAIEQSVKRAE
jgi:hypothetical protein